MNKKLMVFVVALLVLSLGSIAWATQVYVNNKNAGTVIPYRGDQYVSLVKFLRAGGYSWTLQGDTLVIRDGAGSGPQVSYLPKQFSYKGKTFKVFGFPRAGVLFVSAKSLAYGLGLRTKYTQDADAYDFYKAGIALDKRTPPKAPVFEEDQENASPQKKNDTKKETPKPKMVTYKGKDIKKSLIQPKNDFMYDYTMNTLRGRVHFVNKSSDKITKIKVVMKIVDAKGALWTKQYAIGTLEPGGKSKEYDYFWILPYNLDITDRNFQYEISYLEPPKPKSNK